MQGEALWVRITGPLPVIVRGPKTRWTVELDYYGKNGNRCALMAKCHTHGLEVTLTDGRARQTENRHRAGFLVELGSIHFKLCAAMVSTGDAEFFTPGSGLGVDAPIPRAASP